MIKGFGNALAEDLFFDRNSKATRNFPPNLRRSARRKLQLLHDADKLQDLRALPGNRLEKLKGKKKEYYSVRINDQWRIVFIWDDNAGSVLVEDYHN